MAKTRYSIVGEDFLINGQKTYSELPGSNPSIHGLLFNARFIQGVFDDKNPSNMSKYNRFGRTFDPDRNTDELIAALPEWYASGLRAITVGLQGGGPCFSPDIWSDVDTQSFSRDGKTLDAKWSERLERLIAACDEIGMLVIVSILYQRQSKRMLDGVSMMHAVRTACGFLKSLSYENIIIEVANEQDVGDFNDHPLISTGEGMAALIELAKDWSNHKFAVGSSSGGGLFHKEILDYSDVILVHGNGIRKPEMYNFLRRVRSLAPGKPIVCNEDSPLISQLEVAAATHTSWGYYNNFTKQEPPVDWTIQPGEDRFFAERLKDLIHGSANRENDFYLQGATREQRFDRGWFITLAARYPEQIERVEFFEDDRLLYTAFAEPFMLNGLNSWFQGPYMPSDDARQLRAVAHLCDSTIREFTVSLDTLR